MRACFIYSITILNDGQTLSIYYIIFICMYTQIIHVYVWVILILRYSVLDPRVNGWPMLSSPFPTLAICLFYAYFAKTLGPRLMENRKPFQIRKLLIVYNAIQTMFSAWIFYEVSNEHTHIYTLCRMLATCVG